MIRRKVLMDLPEPVPNPEPVEAPPPEKPKEDQIFKQKKAPPKKTDDSLDVIPADTISAPPVAGEQPGVPEPDRPEPATPVPSRKFNKDGTPRKKKQMSQAALDNLAKGRARSLEIRRQKAEEKKRAIAEAMSKVNNPAPVSHANAAAPEVYHQAHPPAERLSAPPPQPPRDTSQKTASVRYDTHQQVLDYQRLSEDVYSKFKQDQTLRQIEMDIRADERRKAQKDYQEQLRKYELDQHKKHQRELAYGLMGRRPNAVFQRTSAIQNRGLYRR